MKLHLRYYARPQDPFGRREPTFQMSARLITADALIPDALLDRTIAELAAVSWRLRNRADQQDGNATLCAAINANFPTPHAWRLRDLIEGGGVVVESEIALDVLPFIEQIRRAASVVALNARAIEYLLGRPRDGEEPSLDDPSPDDVIPAGAWQR